MKGKKISINWASSKLESFALQKRMKRRDTNWEKKYSQIVLLTKDLCPEYMKNYQNSAVWKQTTQVKDGKSILTDTSPKRMNR